MGTIESTILNSLSGILEPEEEPATDERLLGVPRRLVHDVKVGRVEAEGGGGQAVRHQVHPQQLHGDERLGHAQSGSQEDTHNLPQQQHVKVSSAIRCTQIAM